MTVCLRILSVPWGQPALVRDVGPTGETMLFRELFDRESFADLPSRIPIQRMHLRSEPIGWGVPEIRDGGLEVVAELVDTQRARDSIVEIQSGLMAGASIGFSAGPADRWRMPKISAAIPEVLRRGATLHEVSVVPAGAYSDAKVAETFDRDRRHRELSDALLAPMRRGMAVTAEERRRRDAELMDWVDELTAEPVQRRNEPEPSSGPLARLGGQTFAVAAGWDPSAAADEYLRQVCDEIGRRQRALYGDELAELQQRCGLAPVVR